MAAAALSALPARAAQEGKVARIGYLVRSVLVSPPSAERAAFFRRLAELGYVEGKNLVVEYRSARGDPEALPFLARELVDLKVDLIVTAGAEPTRAARDATRTIPIVMLFATDPVGSGLIASLARPGGNVTGMSNNSSDLGAKRLQLLKEALPDIRTVAFLFDSAVFSSAPETETMQAAARALGLVLTPVDVGGADDLTTAFASIRRIRPDALLTLADLRLITYREIIAEFAREQRLPNMSGYRESALAGDLMSYAPSFPELARRAAGYVEKILRGARPADLPVEQPTRFNLVINLKTARFLGITVPPSLLLRADEIIK